MPKPTQRNPYDCITQTEAARVLGVSRPTVVAMIARDDIEAEEVAGFLFPKRASVMRLKERRDAERQSAGQPAA